MALLKNLSGKKILIISPEPWRHNFVSKHHYAISLTGFHNRVFFLNPPSGFDRCSNTSYPGLFVLDYKPFLRGLNRMPEVINRLASAFDVKKIFNLAQTSFDLIWTFDPFRFQFPEIFRAPLNIYFAADWHAARKREVLLADHSQIVLSPSNLLLHSINTKTKKFFINHAAADYFFDPTSEQQLPGHNTVKVGYVGNLHSKFLDRALLTRVIEKNKDCDFIFVGDNSGGGMRDIMGRENVFFLGLFSNDRVPSFLKACDILLLCYNTERYRIQASNSHKLMEYMASGKVIVSTRVEEYSGSPEVVCMPADNSELPDLLGDVKQNLSLFNGSTSREQRIKFAQANTYNAQLARIDAFIEQVKKEKLNFVG